jgi:hypothetical protein
MAEEGEDPDDIRVLLCAPTGKAACNIHGLTIHNAFQIQPNKGLETGFNWKKSPIAIKLTPPNV